MDGEAVVKAPKILLVVGGGIAAYKSCELVRLIRKHGGDVTCVLTDGGSQFVTPMSLAALSENPVHTSLWDLKNEAEMGHIQLSREADLVVVCPATADLMAKMAAGVADDLATTLILATDKPVLAVPAMNVRMWEHDSTQRNVAWLKQAGVSVMDPDEGPMACGEFGPGRLPEPEMVWLEIAEKLGLDPGDAGAQDVEEFLEALEPEEIYDEQEEEQPTGRSRLGSLFASIIPRTTPRRVEVEEVGFDENFDEAAAGEAYEAESGAAAPLDAVAEAPVDPGEKPPVEAFPPMPGEDRPPLAEDTPPPAPMGSLLAGKGKAKAAPPTDREAINHTVNVNQVAPEAFDGEPAAAPVGMVPAAAMLDGQPDFDIDPDHRPLFGKHVLVTAGPTHEPIDPVRYIANRSSGKQGFAIAAAAAALGARVTLVAGPVTLPTPRGVDRIDVESAQEMAAAVKKALPADAAVMVAAVADWRTRDYMEEKMKKRGSAPPALLLTENPDILGQVASGTQRPRLLVGFAAETENLIENAKKKRKSKGADWIVANDVSGGKDKSVMGGDMNVVHIIREKKVDSWEAMPKEDVALRLMEKIADALEQVDA